MSMINKGLAILQNIFAVRQDTNARQVPIGYTNSGTITAAGGSVTIDITIGDYDFYVADIIATAKDSAGKDIEAVDLAADIHTVDVKDEDGRHWFTKPICWNNFTRFIKSYNFMGWALKNRRKLTFTIQATSFPASTKLTYPVIFYIDLVGSPTNTSS